MRDSRLSFLNYCTTVSKAIRFLLESSMALGSFQFISAQGNSSSLLSSLLMGALLTIRLEIIIKHHGIGN